MSNNNNNTQTATSSKPAAHIQREKLQVAIDVIETLRSVSNTMTLNQALVFLMIAQNDGIENLEVRKKSGFAKEILTQLVQVLLESGSKAKAGLDLVAQAESSTNDGRAKSLWLTEKGKKIAEELLNKIN